MQQAIQLLDVVTLVDDLPQSGLVRGQVGTVVARLAPDVFEVEFVDNDGRTYALLPLKRDQILLLHFEPLVAA